MKTIFLSVLMSVGLGAAGFAASHVDANGDGVLTLEEVSAVFPEITGDVFAAMDVNGDGGLDASEVTAAQDAGLLPKG